jgi:hypothetical protein
MARLPEGRVIDGVWAIWVYIVRSFPRLTVRGGDMKSEFRNACRTVAFFVLVLLSSAASAVSFTIDSHSFAPGSGYGIDGLDTGGASETSSVLDVQFSALPGSNSFDLNAVGSSGTGVFGNVTAGGEETYITSAEADNTGGRLNVTANFTFSLPYSGITTVSAIGTAVFGTTIDTEADYTLTWAPLEVSFGDGGLFRIEMNKIQLGTYPPIILTQEQDVTFTLLAMPTAPVPEPEIYAMLGVGLGLMGWVGRRRRRQDATA